MSKQLCHSCGACAAVCPHDAINFKETIGGYLPPIIDEESCTNCGLCYHVCPGIKLGKGLISEMPENPFEGNVLASYVGISRDQELFNNSQSGGVVSALLLHALETKIIQGALTMSMEAGTPPPRPKICIARNKEDLLRSQKSKYCPVPLLSILSELEKADGKVALVGTSCHIHGLYNLLDNKPKLKNKVAFSIGLFCDSVLSLAAIDFLIFKSQATTQKEASFDFRNKAITQYPGDVYVQQGEKSCILKKETRMQTKPFLTLARCRICFDKMNVFSDITVCDPHGLRGIDRRNGESAIVARSTRGLNHILQAEKAKAIQIRKYEYADIINGQKINQKRTEWAAYCRAWEALGGSLPNFGDTLINFKNQTPKSKTYTKKA